MKASAFRRQGSALPFLTLCLMACSSTPPELGDAAVSLKAGSAPPRIGAERGPMAPSHRPTPHERPGHDGCPSVGHGAGGMGAGGEPGSSGSAGDGSGGAGPACTPLDAGLLDDLENGDTLLTSGTGIWYSFNDGTGVQTPAVEAWAPTPSDDGSAFAACLSGNGFTNWGAGIGMVLFNACSDASSIAGVRFRARGHGKVRVEAATLSSTSIDLGGTCSVDCNYHPHVPLTLSDEWQTFELPWSAFQPGTVPLDPRQLRGLQWSAYDDAFPAATPIDFDFCVDDVELYSTPTSTAGTFDFDHDLQQFDLLFGTPPELGSATTLAFEPALGEPSPGSAHLSIPFATPGDQLELSSSGPLDVDVTGKSCSANVLLASGLTSDEEHPGGGFLFIKSGPSYVYAAGEWTNLVPGQWTRVTLDPAAPAFVDTAGVTFDPTHIREVGVHLGTSDQASSVSPAEIYVDSVTCSDIPN